MRNYGRDIVMAAAPNNEIHKAAACGNRGRLLIENRFDQFIVDYVRKTVSA